MISIIIITTNSIISSMIIIVVHCRVMFVCLSWVRDSKRRLCPLAGVLSLLVVVVVVVVVEVVAVVVVVPLQKMIMSARRSSPRAGDVKTWLE